MKRQNYNSPISSAFGNVGLRAKRLIFYGLTVHTLGAQELLPFKFISCLQSMSFNFVNVHISRNLFLSITDNKIHVLTFYKLLGEKRLSSFPLDLSSCK